VSRHESDTFDEVFVGEVRAALDDPLEVRKKRLASASGGTPGPPDSYNAGSSMSTTSRTVSIDSQPIRRSNAIRCASIVLPQRGGPPRSINTFTWFPTLLLRVEQYPIGRSGAVSGR
jgi:hypothetical protein